MSHEEFAETNKAKIAKLNKKIKEMRKAAQDLFGRDVIDLRLEPLQATYPKISLVVYEVTKATITMPKMKVEEVVPDTE